MKNVLAIEIKDNKTIATLTREINGSHNLLLHKTYGSKPLINSIFYDITIIDQIKKDLLKMGMFESIDESYLTINTKRTVVQTFSIELKYGTNIVEKKEEVCKKLGSTYPQFVITELIFSDTNATLTKKDVNVTVEFVEREYMNEIKKQFRYKGLGFNGYIPLIKSIQNATKTNEFDEGITFSILVEEKFTQLTTIENGSITSSKKWDNGLTNIYEYISESMRVNKAAAKKLFKSFGSIPPEDVVDDKIVHSRNEGKELVVFTKKDLSKYITERVNELFANIKTEVDPFKSAKNIKIIFNGEIKSLVGFKKYASKSFAEPNIERFSTQIIGLNEETEFITTGILEQIKPMKNFVKKQEMNTSRINIFNKFIRMYNYI